MLKILFGLAVIVLSYSSLACVGGDGNGFLPQNDMYIPPFSTKSILEGGIDEGQFNSVLNRVENVYAPIIRQYGGNLKINRKWSDGTVNAQAHRQGSTWNVDMFGGLARHQETTEDSFMLVACHEVGHHIGGVPRYSTQLSWASTEGQSDYFAVTKCMRKIMRDEDNESIIKKMKIDPAVTTKCEAQFSNANEIAMCKRISMAGLAAARLFGSSPRFDTPDPSVVTQTYESHPQSQCRLDTYFQGGNCTVGEDVEIGQNDPNSGTCNRQDKYTEGLRPLCWYKPTGGNNPPPPPPVGEIAKTPTVNGQTSISSNNPNQIIPIVTDVSGFSGVAMIAIEFSKPNKSFRNPNSTEPDRQNGLRVEVHNTITGTYKLLPARQLPGWGTYQIRVIGLDRNRKPVSKNSNAFTLNLGR